MRLAVLALGALVALPLSLSADVVYSYTGNDFTYSSTNNMPTNPPGSVATPYSTSDFVSGYFTVAAPLTGLSSLTYVTADSFSFSDGVQTLSTANGDSLFLEVTTNSSGNITNWVVDAQNPSVASDFITSQSFGGSPADFGKFVTQGGDVVGAGSNVTGSFSGPAPTPEPSSLALLGTGALGVLTQVRRRLRRA